MLFRIAPLLVLASFPLRGEEAPKELSSLAETLVADRQPDFVLERQQTTTFQIVQLWEMRPAPDGASSGPYVEIRIFRYGSADAADEGLEAIRKSSNVSPIATFDGSDNASFVSVPGLGEKSYV